MSTFGSLEEIWRRSLDLNLRYYGALGQLTADYVKDLSNAFSEAQLRQKVDLTSPLDVGTVKTPPAEATPAPNTNSQAGAMVLEGESGSKVLGVFLVENHLNREISARVVASSFVAANGNEVKPEMIFDPELIALGPGEQSLVRVVVAIDDSLDLEVRYLGQFTIPELTGTRVPVVLRRRLGQEIISVAAVKQTARKAGSKTKKPAGGRAKKSKRPA